MCRPWGPRASPVFSRWPYCCVTKFMLQLAKGNPRWGTPCRLLQNSTEAQQHRTDLVQLRCKRKDRDILKQVSLMVSGAELCVPPPYSTNTELPIWLFAIFRQSLSHLCAQLYLYLYPKKLSLIILIVQTGIVTKFWICIREVLSSNLGRNTDYPDRGSSWFSSVHPCKCWV
jgi:hypothetical protein